MKIGYLMAGLLILANPNIGIVDFLPDFFAYLLIIHAIRTSAVLIPHWNDALKGLTKMTVVSIVKLLCLPLIFKNIDSLPILLSFSFALIELIFLLPTIHKLFEGLFYAGMRYDITSVFSYRPNPQSQNKQDIDNKKEFGPKVKRITIGFLIFKAFVSILPTLSDLQLFEHSGEVTDGYIIRFADFNNLFVIIAFSVGLIGSIVWMTSFMPFFSRLSKDVAWCNFSNICDRIRKSPEFADKLALQREFIFLIISVCTSVFIPIDGINYLVGAIPAVFLIITAMLHRKYNKFSYFIPIPALICAISSFIELVERYRFFSEFKYEAEAALWLPNAQKIYSNMAPFNILDRLFLLVALLSVLRLTFIKWDDDFYDFSSEATDTYARERHISLKRNFKLFWWLSIPLFILTALEPYLLLQIDFISVVLTLLNIVWVLFVVFNLLDMMKERYTLEADEFSVVVNKETTL